MIKVMLDNNGFLKVVSDSFTEFLNSGTSRSTAKLIPLHGAIARDIAERLGNEYVISAKGYGDGKESSISGRYIEKSVYIKIAKNNVAFAGISVKFVMQNYSKNSNNYFEQMLGETANIRSAQRLYFQIFVILDKLPYYNSTKKITKWETLSEHNISKYAALSQDDISCYSHTPNKTLVFVVHIPDNEDLTTLDEYLGYYKHTDYKMQLSERKYVPFGPAVIMNDYKTFMDKVYFTIMAL